MRPPAQTSSLQVAMGETFSHTSNGFISSKNCRRRDTHASVHEAAGDPFFWDTNEDAVAFILWSVLRLT